MAPTSAMWEHPTESATSVTPAQHRTATRGADAETPWKRRSARIAAIQTQARHRQQQISSRRLEPRPRQGRSQARGMPSPSQSPSQQRSRSRSRSRISLQDEQYSQSQRLSPAPADTATAAEAATAEHLRGRHASLAHVMWRTLVLMHSNRLLALQVEALKRETAAFVCSVLSNRENQTLLPPTTTQQKQQQQPTSS